MLYQCGYRHIQKQHGQHPHPPDLHLDLLQQALFPSGAYETLADKLASETDRILNESTDFGIGRLQWEGMQLYEPTPEYYGYVLQYSASDFGRKRA